MFTTCSQLRYSTCVVSNYVPGSDSNNNVSTGLLMSSSTTCAVSVERSTFGEGLSISLQSSDFEPRSLVSSSSLSDCSSLFKFSSINFFRSAQPFVFNAFLLSISAESSVNPLKEDGEFDLFGGNREKNTIFNYFLIHFYLVLHYKTRKAYF